MKTLSKMFTITCWSICVGALLFASGTEEEKLVLEQEQQAQNEIQTTVEVKKQERQMQREIPVYDGEST